MSHTTQSRFLHVANGTSTTGTIEAAGIPGALSIWADPLYEGPVPGRISDAELLDVRARYLAGSTGPGSTAGGETTVDSANVLRDWRSTIERHESYDELILWFEHDLFDQLNLVQLLSWIHERLPTNKRVSLVCIGSFPGHPAFKGLGELTPGELASLLETRQRVTERQYALATVAWDAFRQSTPEALDGLRKTDTSPLPYLSAALTRFLQEYPWTTDGLSRSERRLLQLADAGVSLSQAFPRMHEAEEAYYITDLSLAALADDLSNTSPPILTLEPRPAGTSRSLHATIRLTETGRAILAGDQDRIAACGIDRWLGGVHVHPLNIWRWDEATRSMTRDGVNRRE